MHSNNLKCTYLYEFNFAFETRSNFLLSSVFFRARSDVLPLLQWLLPPGLPRDHQKPPANAAPEFPLSALSARAIGEVA